MSVRWLVLMMGMALPMQAPTGSRKSSDAAPVWTWSGVEVIGQRTIFREAIVRQVPLALGSPFDEDEDKWEALAQDLRKKFYLHFVEVYPVRYADRQAFLIVEIVEKGDESRMAYRDAPTGQEEIPSDLAALYEQLVQRLDDLFRSGNPPQEDAAKGYLDYADGKAHEIVLKLIDVARPHRSTLLKVVARDADAFDRAAAANLLNWAGDVERSILEVHPCANDVDAAVRNNVTRFMVHYVDRLESSEARRAVIDTLAGQLRHPSHGDRNKAVYALLGIAQAFPRERPYIRDKAAVELKYIADTSILSNVRDPAKELLDLLGK